MLTTYATTMATFRVLYTISPHPSQQVARPKQAQRRYHEQADQGQRRGVAGARQVGVVDHNIGCVAAHSLEAHLLGGKRRANR